MKIAVLLSGGVDSSVALKLLKNEGHDLTAFYLKIWLEDELAHLGSCPWEEDLKYARAVCRQENIPLKIISLQKEYFEKVVKYTIKEVKKGRTPNPDIMCNNNIKFGLFFEKISKNFEKIASGHYAQIIQKSGKYFLKKTPDQVKDQTYFLADLKQKQLKKILFPIGNLKKSEVRELAEKYDLPNKNRKDSQGICFLGKLKFEEFLYHYLGRKKGNIYELESGKKVGEHDGFWYYTIGQRKEIKLAGGPWYVAEKDPKKNIIYVSRNYHSPEKKRNQFIAGDFNWFEGKPPKKKNLQVKIRHGEKIYKCKLKYIKNKSSQTRTRSRNSFALVQINGNDQGIAPGQFAVFYDKEICLGSAIIQ